MIDTFNLSLMRYTVRMKVLIYRFILILMCIVSRLLKTKYIFFLFLMCNLIIQFTFEIGLKLFKTSIKENFTLLASHMDQLNSKIYNLILSYLKVHVKFLIYCNSMYYKILNCFILLLNQLNIHVYSILNIVQMSNKLSLFYIGSDNQQHSFQAQFFTTLNYYDERI